MPSLQLSFNFETCNLFCYYVRHQILMYSYHDGDILSSKGLKHAHTHKRQRSVCHYLWEKGASHELLVLKEGDALAAVELFSQVSHIRLEFGKSCHTQAHTHTSTNILPHTLTFGYSGLYGRAHIHCIYMDPKGTHSQYFHDMVPGKCALMEFITYCNLRNIQSLSFSHIYTHTHTTSFTFNLTLHNIYGMTIHRFLNA